jgi:sterol desaturase/sphingolipid hydroxylase (fatty acid hydroxylase superfamily)
MTSWIDEFATRVFLGLLVPLREFLIDGGSRYFWLYCVTGLAIAAYTYHKHREARDFQTTLMDPNVWLSRSALNDYVIIVVTPVLRLTVLSWAFLNWKSISAFVASTLHAAGVTGTATGTTAVALGVLLTLVLFVADDFFRWYAHYLFHRIPELWEFHKVHHSAEVLNFATSERHHPVEIVMNGLVLTSVYGIINGIFIGVFGDQVTVATVAGANLFLFAFNVCGGVLRHSPFWISFGPSVERWIISPAMHQIHHSAKIEHYDRNMGGSLAIWDRMFGTIHIPKAGEIGAYGIGAETADFRSLEVIYFRPFKAAAERLSQRIKKRRPGAAEAATAASA